LPDGVKRCLIFNPFYAVLGGGERYTIAMGDVIAESHEVTYASPWPPNPELNEQLGFPDVDVQRMQLEEFPRASADYDLAVMITLHVPPPSFATRSVLVVQFPRGATLGGHSRQRRRTVAKLRRYDRVVYSAFVREWLERRWGVTGDVLMPGIRLPDGPTGPKENMILSVGRFLGLAENQWNSKRHDVLIDAFSQLPERLRRSWRLVLAGGCAPSPEMDAYLDDLRRRAAGLDVTFEVNAAPDRLADLQARARLFWHASGYERPADEPEGAEHFGMSTAEAMSNAAIPLVYADGGQLEIVDERFGRLWRSVPELVTQTTELMDRPPADLDAMGAAARAASERFGIERFRSELRALLARIGALRASDARASRVARRYRRRATWHAYRGATRVDQAATRVARALRA
jgi:glycosyltransferase involved in cell wall biosynthesis